jgi:hypothetical protein
VHPCGDMLQRVPIAVAFGRSWPVMHCSDLLRSCWCLHSSAASLALPALPALHCSNLLQGVQLADF